MAGNERMFDLFRLRSLVPCLSRRERARFSKSSFTSAWNLTFAYHRRLPHDELYVAYGDASQLSTLPQFVLKLIHYFGAEKGT
jgi:hypothetical protein